MNVKPSDFSTHRYSLLLAHAHKIPVPKSGDPSAPLGVLRQLSEDNQKPLSPKQMHHWSESLLPLVNVHCDGPIGAIDEEGTSSCLSEAPLSDEEYWHYLLDEACLCFCCRHDVQNYLSGD